MNKRIRGKKVKNGNKAPKSWSQRQRELEQKEQDILNAAVVKPNSILWKKPVGEIING